MLVNEVTLLPLLLPLAPARTLLARLPEAIAGVLAAHNVLRELIEDERAAMADIRVAPTANRSVVGIVNEFGYLASAMRADFADNLLGLAVHLSRTPCSPLYDSLVSPDRELAARVAEHIAH